MHNVKSTALQTLKVLWVLFAFVGLNSCNKTAATSEPEKQESLTPISFSQIKIDGELLTRAIKNYDRLEEEIYQPENVFPLQHDANSAGWPGDKEGRIILGLTLQAQATGREPRYLKEMIEMYPKKVNRMGYLGPVHTDSIQEQQLSGHGWLLRGLCEYYEWKKDPKVKGYIQDIIQNLALPTKGAHSNYPIAPSARLQNVGEAAGSTQNTVGKWMLSSDIGCDFIFMDGLVQAYGLFPSQELKELIDEMVARFFEMDLVAIKAQTHATLTGLRGVLRYYKITQKDTLLQEVKKRYQDYHALAMTENYENYNWFERPEWTEPCAIIDSYMLAVQLWQYTRNADYLEDAQHIYYNAIAHTQRVNGGFGLDNCPGPSDRSLRVLGNEAYWCCTMRGGEGLAKAIQYNYFTAGNSIYMPFFNSSVTSFYLKNQKITIKQRTNYPFSNKVLLQVLSSGPADSTKLHFFAPSWTKNYQLEINGVMKDFKLANGFVEIVAKLEKGTTIAFSFDMKSGVRPIVNAKHTLSDVYPLYYGPLLLGYEGAKEIAFDQKPELIRQTDSTWLVKNENIVLTPVYHLLNGKVWEGTGYQKQILFPLKK